MRTVWLALITFAVVLALLEWRDRGAPAPAAWSGCTVEKIVDGDTLDVRCADGRERVRLLRVDTPEREERGHDEARRALATLVRDRDVALEFERPGVAERGDHGRLLAYVLVGGRNVNVELVRLGWSRFFTRYGEGRHAAAFASAERDARAAGRGLWAVRGAPGPR